MRLLDGGPAGSHAWWKHGMEEEPRASWHGNTEKMENQAGEVDSTEYLCGCIQLTSNIYCGFVKTQKNGVSIKVEILILQYFAEQTQHNSVPVTLQWTMYLFNLFYPSSNHSTFIEYLLWVEHGVHAEITKVNQAPSLSW